MNDIGIRYTPAYQKIEGEYIYCACLSSADDDFLIVRKSDAVLFDPTTRRLTEIALPEAARVVACVEAPQGWYLLDRSGRCVWSLRRDGSLQIVRRLPDGWVPLAFCKTSTGFVVSGTPSGLLILDGEREVFLDLLPLGFKEPISVEDIGSGGFLIADSLAHVVREVSVDGRVNWQYGSYGDPGARVGQLCYPLDARRLRADTTLIVDQRNHRVLEVSHPGEIVREYGRAGCPGSLNGLLWMPRALLAIKGLSRYWILEDKAGRIASIDAATGETRTVYGHPKVAVSELNFPRACEWSELWKELAVADTGNNRVVCFDANGKATLTFHGDANRRLYWPRCVSWAGEHLIITDSRNGSILCITRKGRLVREWRSDALRCAVPEDEWLQSAGISGDGKKLLLSWQTVVSLLDAETTEEIWSSRGRVCLRDVHYAELTEDRSVLVADTGNDRVVEFLENGSVQMLTQVHSGTETMQLAQPRFVRRYSNETWVVDSARARVFSVDSAGTVKWSVGEERGLGPRSLSAPRWLCRGPHSDLFISDSDNHRIVRICAPPGSKAKG